jgi:hypothetical protein
MLMTTLKLTMSLAFLALLCSCSSTQRRQSSPELNTRAALAVTNFTGSPLRGVYLSHSDAPGWEENILGSTDLQDGDTMNINFATDCDNNGWDLRVEGIDGHYAEWKDVKLGGASRITLLLKLSSQPVAVAEIE